LNKATTEYETELFDLLERLLSLPKLSRDAVAEATNIDFAPVDEDYFSTFYGMSRDGSFLDGLELRVPGSKVPSTADGLLILKIRPTTGIGLEQVERRYGMPLIGILSPPKFSWGAWIQCLFRRPENPFYYTYTRSGGKLSFRFLNWKNRQLIKVIIDRTDRR